MCWGALLLLMLASPGKAVEAPSRPSPPARSDPVPAPTTGSSATRGVDPDDPGAVVAAIVRAGTSARPADLRRIAGHLDDPNTSYRLAAARMLARAGDPPALEKLARQAASPQAPQRFEALTVLREAATLPPFARTTVERALTEEDPALRLVALEVLHAHPAVESVPAVAGVLADGNRDVRLAAMALLGKTPDVRGMTPLLERIDLPERTERIAVIRALASFGRAHPGLSPGPAVARQLSDDNDEVRLAAIVALGRLRWASAVPELGRLAWQRTNSALSGRATLALGAIASDAAVATLVELLREPAPAEEVVRALREAGPSAVAPVAAILADAFTTSAIAAMEILAQVGDRAATPALVRALQTRPTVAISAARALGALRDPAAVDALLRSVSTPAYVKAPAVRAACLRALTAIGDRKAVSAIEAGATDADPGVRAAALELASRLRDGLSAQTAAARLRDTEPSVRLAALTAWPLLGPAAVTVAPQDGIPEIARVAPGTRERLCATLAVMRTPAADAQLITLMENDADVGVRAAAAWAARLRRETPPVAAALERARGAPIAPVAANATAAMTVSLAPEVWTTLRLLAPDGVPVGHRWVRVWMGARMIWARSDGRGEVLLSLPPGTAHRVSLAPDDQDALTSATASGRSPAMTPGTP